MTYQLGVDLGTTFTAAAVTDGRAPTMVGLGNRSLEVPSVVYWTDTEFLVGEVAERRGIVDPGRVARLFKRRLGDPVPVLVGGSPFSAEFLTARLLRWVVDRTAERRGEPPSGLTLTHPANWGEYKLDVLRQAVELAEVGPAAWLPEPVAAAAQYASRTRVPMGARLAVYDLGGGTLDVCVVEKRGEGFEILGSPEGIEHLGGADFDEAVFQQVIRSLGDRAAELDPEDSEVTVGLARLRRECVEAKEALSSDAEVAVPVSLPGLATTVRVGRSELESLLRPALEGTFTTLGRVLRSAGLTSSDLVAIVLVGGSSRIPLVADLLQKNFEVSTAVDTHPKHDVVLGAMQVAAQRAQGRTVVRPAPVGAVALSSGPPTSDPSGAGERTGVPRRLVVGALAAAVVAGVVVGAAVHFRGQAGAVDAPAGEVTLAPTTSSAKPSTSPSPSPSARLASLPRSTPLKAGQLIVPMKVQGNWDLYLADDSRREPVRRLTTDDDSEYGQVLSPDRATMIYLRDPDVTDKNRPLWVAGAADGQDARPLFATVPDVCSGMMYRPAWSKVDPDQLAVPCTDAAGRWGLYLMRTDGTDVREITQPGRAVDDPTFSPDGTQLAFWSGSDPKWDGGNLYIATLGGRAKLRQLTSSKIAGRDADPTWSKDGQTIVFRRRVVDGTPGGNADIYRVPANGSSTPVPLAQSSADEQDPSFSASGREIAYKSAEPTGVWPGAAVPRVWVMKQDGSDQHVLWTRDAPDQQTAPAWSRR